MGPICGPAKVFTPRTLWWQEGTKEFILNPGTEKDQNKNQRSKPIEDGDVLASVCLEAAVMDPPEERTPTRPMDIFSKVSLEIGQGRLLHRIQRRPNNQSGRNRSSSKGRKGRG
jgi:hypothetical protein